MLAGHLDLKKVARGALSLHSVSKDYPHRSSFFGDCAKSNISDGASALRWMRVTKSNRAIAKTKYTQFTFPFSPLERLALLDAIDIN